MKDKLGGVEVFHVIIIDSKCVIINRGEAHLVPSAHITNSGDDSTSVDIYTLSDNAGRE